MTRHRSERVATKTELFRLFLSEQLDPDEFYSKLADRTLSRFDLPLVGKVILDLGSGPGHYTAALSRAGATVVALDLNLSDIEQVGARGLPAVHGDATRLPFIDGAFDGVFSSNLLEHVPDQSAVFDEIERVLRPGGWAWVSWTNWYSPWGGHLITPFHYLGPRLGSRVHERLKGPPVRNRVFDGLWPAHIGPVLRDVRSRPALRLRRAMPRYYPSQRWILRVPGLREFVTWNCLLVIDRTISQPTTTEHSATDAGFALPSAWRRVVRRQLRAIRMAMSDHPAFLPVVLRLTPRGLTRRIDDSTQLVVEGYPRSSNTFAVGALIVASSGAFKVVGHVHAPSQVRLAVRRRLPTLVVIRDPRATVQSLIVAAPHVRPRRAIREWIHFYEELWDIRDGFVVATFEQVTTDMGAVARRIEERFLTPVPRFVHDEQSLAELDRHMADEHRKWHPDDIRSAPWPSNERSLLSQAVGAALEDVSLDPLWGDAVRLYERYESLAR